MNAHFIINCLSSFALRFAEGSVFDLSHMPQVPFWPLYKQNQSIALVVLHSVFLNRSKIENVTKFKTGNVTKTLHFAGKSHFFHMGEVKNWPLPDPEKTEWNHILLKFFHCFSFIFEEDFSQFEWKIFIIFSSMLRKFWVSRARWGRVLPESEERIEKFVDTASNGPLQVGEKLAIFP